MANLSYFKVVNSDDKIVRGFVRRVSDETGGLLRIERLTPKLKWKEDPSAMKFFNGLDDDAEQISEEEYKKLLRTFEVA